MNSALLRTEELSIGRGDRILVRSLNLSVEPGTALHLRGRNGVGKTSLLEVLAGLRAPESGTVHRPGAGLHWLGHKNALNADLTVSENLGFWCDLQRCGAERLLPALQAVGMAALRHRACRSLSAGQKRRAALARLLLVSRPLWLLDEPLSALDAEGLQVFSGLLATHLEGGGAAVVSSHQALPVAAVSLRDIELA